MHKEGAVKVMNLITLQVIGITVLYLAHRKCGETLPEAAYQNSPSRDELYFRQRLTNPYLCTTSEKQQLVNVSTTR